MKAYTILLGTGLLLAAGGPEYADACTRVVYEGTNRTVVTGRTMDWKEDPAATCGSSRAAWSETARPEAIR